MKHVVASELIPKKCQETLEALGYTVIKLPSCQELGAPVSSHPDMLLFLYGNKYICSRDYYAYASNAFEQLNALGYSPILSSEMPGKKYPHDVLFNCLLLGNSIYGLTDHISLHIKELAKENGIKLKSVRQGYTKCSVCKVSENAIITSDQGIARSASDNGIDVLLISPGHIGIDEYDCGFIGGCSGSDDKNVYFCGSISRHPDAERIEAFCKKHNKECISLSDDTLFDIGTLFFV